MLYFFHHYELPLILQQAQLQQFLLRAQQRPAAEAIEAMERLAAESPGVTRVITLQAASREPTPVQDEGRPPPRQEVMSPQNPPKWNPLTAPIPV